MRDFVVGSKKLRMILMPHWGSFFVDRQGTTQLESHMKCEKHKQKTPPDPAAGKQKTLMFASTSNPTWGTTTKKDNKEKRQHTLDKDMLSEDTVKAEIMWLLQVLKNKSPYWSCASKSSFFAEMFKDSKIAQSFTLRKTEFRQVICYGIAPYCKDLVMGVLERTAFVVILFVEAFSSSVKKGQTDMHIQFWNDSNSQVSTRVLNCKFFGKASVVDVLEKFDACCSALDKNKVIQVGFHLVCCFNIL